MPVSVGRLVTSSVKASMPPAEAPIAAIRRSFLRSEGEEAREPEAFFSFDRRVDFDFMQPLRVFPKEVEPLGQPRPRDAFGWRC